MKNEAKWRRKTNGGSEERKMLRKRKNIRQLRSSQHSHSHSNCFLQLKSEYQTSNLFKHTPSFKVSALLKSIS